MRFTLASVALTMIMTGTAALAADMPAGLFANSCNSSLASSLDQLPQSEIEAKVAAYFGDATSAVESPSVVVSRSPAFAWANSARIACGQALGYLETGYVDVETVRKCDCFHNRYTSFR